jgi:hypothetical protein
MEMRSILYSVVIPRLGLGIHEFLCDKLVDARPKTGHDDLI